MKKRLSKKEKQLIYNCWLNGEKSNAVLRRKFKRHRSTIYRIIKELS